MADLRRTPSLQHAVALIRPTVQETVIEMEKLDLAKIPFSLNPGRKLFKPMMEGQPLDWALRQVEADKHQKNIKPNKGLVTAFSLYSTEMKVSWFRECQAHGYPIGGGVVIPVRPSGFWVQDCQLRVLWTQCWQGRTLDPSQRAIFNTILRQTFFVGDFKEAQLEWLDLREKSPRKGREVEVINGAAFGTVAPRELEQALRILLEAFEIHSEHRKTRRADEKRRGPQDRGVDLFRSGDSLD